MRKTNITNDVTRHGVVLNGNDVKRIFDAIGSMRGDYPKVASELLSVIGGADLSCVKCEPACMDVLVCEWCQAEFYEEDGTNSEPGPECADCEAKRYAEGAAEAACHVPMPTDKEAAEIRRLKGM